MKKIKLVIISLLLLVPSFVNAEEVNKFKVQFEDTLNVEEDLNGSAIIGANELTTNNTINGASLLFGNNIKFNTNTDYTAIFGNNIQVKGNIKDAAIFGNVITFDENTYINRDIIIFASSVTLKGYIGRNITIYANKIEINGTTIEGNLKVDADELNINSTTSINGTLSYNDTITTNIDKDTSIYEIKTYEKNVEEESFTSILWSKILSLFKYLVIFTVLFYLVPKLFNKLEKNTDMVKNIGIGLVFLFVIPICVLLLLCTVIGSSLCLLLLTFYIALLLNSLIFSGYVVGNMLWNKFVKKENNKYLTGLLGITLIFILKSLPYIGTLISFISILIGSGVIVILFKKNKK